MESLSTTIQPYLNLLPYFLLSGFAAFLLTPLFGQIAKRVGAIDAPRRLRRPLERGYETRLHTKPIARLGGLAVIIPALIIMIIAVPISKPVIGIYLGIVILIIGGIIDDRYEANPKLQIAFQLGAAITIVLFGIGLTDISTPFGVINMRAFVYPLFQIGRETLSIVFPSDLFVICWIIMIINALKWVFGSDAVGEGISAIGFLTLLMVGIQSNAPTTALIGVVFFAGILGFIPFNFYPAKIYTGTTGQYVYGFVIGAVSLLGEAKTLTSLVVLFIPLLDMLWVILGRVWRDRIFNPLKLIQVSDRTHLHHRLSKLGLSVIQVALVEYLLVGLTAIIAFTLGDFQKARLLTIVIVAIGVFFLMLSMMGRLGLRLKKDDNGMKKQKKKGNSKKETRSPEDRYAY